MLSILTAFQRRHQTAQSFVIFMLKLPFFTHCDFSSVTFAINELKSINSKTLFLISLMEDLFFLDMTVYSDAEY